MPDRHPGPAVNPLVAAVCYLVAILAGEWGFVTTGDRIPYLWPAGGLLLAFLGTANPGQWPRLLVSLWIVAFGVEFAVLQVPDKRFAPVLALTYSGIDLLEGCLGALALRRLCRGRVQLARALDVIRLLLVVYFFSAPLAAALGTITTIVHTPVGPVLTFWRACWLSSALGVTTFAPLAILLVHRTTRRRPLERRTALEAVAWSATGVVVCLTLFRAVKPGSSLAPATLYLPLLLVIAAATRFELFGAALANLLVALIASTQTASGFGPFAALPDAPAQTLGLQLYLITLQAIALSVAGALDERRRAYTAQRQSESLLRGLVENAPVAVFLKDTRGRYLLANQAYTRMLGREPEHTLQATDAALLPPERVDAVAAFDRQIAETGVPLEIEEDWHGPDGPRTCLALRFPLRGPDGEIYALGGFLTDITSRRKAEAELQESERLRRRILDASPQIVYVLELAGPRITYLSRRVQDYLGLQPEELLARSPLGLLNLTHPDDANRLRETLATWSRAEDHEVRTCEYRLRDTQGRWRWFLEHGAVFQRSPEGAVLQIVGVVQDVTEQKQAELEIRQLNTELEQRVQERTRELHQRVADADALNRKLVRVLQELQAAQQQSDLAASRLAAANTQLDLANRELEAFSYSVSHDLQAPLRNVAGFVDLLARSEEHFAPQTRHYFNVILQETRRMGDLIRDLLGFSRIGRAALRRETVDMRALAARAWDTLGHDRGQRQIQWTLDPIPAAYGDPSLLALVWANLLSNALKYSRPRTTAQIHVGTLPDAQNDQTVYFVRDNGVGFDMKYADKLFGVFQRLHSTKDFEGTGIGLANVQRIVARHGGCVWAQSAKDVGTTFFFSLPTDQA